MFNKFGIILLFSLSFFTLSLFAGDYKLELPLDIIAQSQRSSAIGLNDHDEMLVQYFSNDKETYAIWSPSKPLEIIPEISNALVGLFGSYQFVKLSNNGMILGRKNEWSYPSKITPVVWSRALGLQELNISKDISSEGAKEFILVDANSFGQIVGNYNTLDRVKHAFIWERGRAREFSIDKDLERLGYKVINTEIIAINDKGVILGSFDSVFKHPLKGSWVVKKTVYFLWNGDSHIIDIPSNNSFQVKNLNNNNQVLLNIFVENNRDEYSQAFLWSVDNGLEPILSLQDNFHGYKINDKGQIIGYSSILRRHCLVDQSGIVDFIPQSSTEFVTVHSPSDINNNGTILSSGEVWKENHFFVFRRPKK